MKNPKGLKSEGIRNSLIRTCPVCGFTFRAFDPKRRKKLKTCPMCGHNFLEPNKFEKTF